MMFACPNAAATAVDMRAERGTQWEDNQGIDIHTLASEHTLGIMKK